MGYSAEKTSKQRLINDDGNDRQQQQQMLIFFLNPSFLWVLPVPSVTHF